MKIKHAPDHTPLRRDAYPSIEDQLDALWHAMDRGELPKISGFYDPIRTIKERFPKPI